MPVSDPREDLIRLLARDRGKQSKSRVTTFEQAMQPRGRVAPLSEKARNSAAPLVGEARRMFKDASRRVEAEKIARGEKKKADEGGWRGLAGGILENSVVQTILKPLEILDVPRRAVISGIHEVSDAIGSGDASWTDFKEQVDDPSYGVGKYVDTGHKWLDRALGFVGDVALDPLTYVTFGGTAIASKGGVRIAKGSSAAGEAGRLAMARRALEVGIDPVRAAGFARGGRAATTAEELQRMGYNKAGVYFFGKRLKAVRIPFTGLLGEASEKTLNRMRIIASESALGKYARKAFTRDVNRDARMMLASGKFPEGQAADLIYMVTSRDVQRAASAKALDSAQRRLVTLAKAYGDGDATKTAYEVMEGVKVGLPTDAEVALSAAATAELKGMRNEVEETFKSLDPEARIGKEENYFPWMRTDEANEFLADPTKTYSNEVGKGWDDGDPLGVFKHRELSAKVKGGRRVIWFGHTLEVSDLNVKRLNELARAGGFKGDFFETDVIRVLDSYSRQYAEQMGLLARYGEMSSKGAFRRMDEVLTDSTVVDEKGLALQVKRVADTVGEMKTTQEDARSALRNVRQTVTDRAATLRSRIGKIDAAYDTTEVIEVGNAWARATRELREANSLLSSQYDTLHRLFDGEPPSTAIALQDELTEVGAELERITSTWDAVVAERVDSIIDDMGAARRLDVAAEELLAVEERLTALTRTTESVVESSEFLQSRYDDILAGHRTNDAWLNKLGRAVGTIEPRKGELTRYGAEAGTLDQWMRKNLDDLEWFRLVNGDKTVAVSSRTIASMDAGRVQEIITRATAGFEPTHEVRAAAMWLLAQDDKFFTLLPAPLAEQRVALVRELIEAASADRLARSASAARESGAASIAIREREGEMIEVFTRMSDDMELSTKVNQALGDNFINVDHLSEAFAEGLSPDALNVITGASINGMIPITPEMRDRLLDISEELSGKVYEVGRGVDRKVYDLSDLENGRLSGLINASQADVSVPNDPGNASLVLAMAQKQATAMAEVMSRYKLMSDVYRRFTAVGETLAPTGLVPSERMMRDVVNAAASDQLDVWRGKRSIVATSQDALRAVRSRYEEIVNDPAFTNVAGEHGNALRRALDATFEGEGGAELQEFLGPMVSAFESPAAMNKRLSQSASGPNSINGVYSKELRTRYSNDVVRPWWHSVRGSERYGVDKAKKLLNQLKLDARRGPFSKQSRRRDVDEFFATLEGGEITIGPIQSDIVRQPRNRRTTARAPSPPLPQMKHTVRGVLVEEAERAEQMVQLFVAAADPNVDVHRFLLDPGTPQMVPSLYADALRTFAGSLERTLDVNLPAAREAARTAGELAKDKARNADARATTIDRVVNEKMPKSQGKPPAWEKEARRTTQQIFRLKATPEYSAALADNDMHRMIMDLAPYDLTVIPYVNAGGKVPTPIKMPDGQTLRFSKAEARSLYERPQPRRVPQLIAENDAAVTRIERLHVRREAMEKRLLELRLSERPVGLPLLNRFRAELDGVVETIEELTRFIDNVRIELELEDLAVRASALEKIRILTQGTDRHFPFNPKSLREDVPTGPAANSISAPPTTNVVKRRAWLVSPGTKMEREVGQSLMHEQTASGKLYAKVKGLTETIEVRKFDQWMKTAGNVEKEATRLRNKAIQKDAAVAAELARAEELQRFVVDVAQRAERNIPDAPAKLANVDDAATARRAAAELDEIRPPDTDLTRPAVDYGDDITAQQGALGQAKIDELNASAANTVAERRSRKADINKQNVEATVRSLSERQQAVLDELDVVREDTIGRAVYGKDRKTGNQVVKKVTGLRGETAETQKRVDDLVGTVDELAASHDSKMLVVRYGHKLSEQLQPKLQAELDMIEGMLNGAPNIGKKLSAEQTEEASEWVGRARMALGATNVASPAIAGVLATAAVAEARMITSAMRHGSEDVILGNLKRGTTMRSIETQVTDGYRALADLGLPSLEARTEIANMMSRMQRLEEPRFAREVNSFLGPYTRFFKSYATLSPGFHVRNALSNTFGLISADASMKNSAQGFKLWKSLRAGLDEDLTTEQWVASLPVAQREHARIAADVMWTIGGGRTQEQLAGQLRKRSVISDNKLLRGSRNVGMVSESSAHFMLAYDSAVKGMDQFQAGARTKRYLVDYQDVSAADENIRSIVPFWMWMSRNLPLQIVNQWTNPRAYAVYNSFKRNVAQDDEGEVVPSWLDEMGATKIGTDTYLAPDLGFARLQEQLGELKDPKRLLSYVNPGLRAPVEIAGGTQFYNDVPFSNKKQKLIGPLKALAPLAETLGLAERNADGEIVVDAKLNYFLKNMIPTLAQADRLTPSADSDRVGANWMAYLGSPVRKVTPSMREGEIRRRRNELFQMQRAAESLGYKP